MLFNDQFMKNLCLTDIILISGNFEVGKEFDALVVNVWWTTAHLTSLEITLQVSFYRGSCIAGMTET
ncbi:hypothetical protein EB796_017700 [Bugula neritina]|uniref:Uncharacterized protein n=1 Tax=Bugula neritina TaxID=10212 RepID=A0A7J7JED6_BUGNE|nr:hypothetical protein EB796_017700 [Bugula neritina]